MISHEKDTFFAIVNKETEGFDPLILFGMHHNIIQDVSLGYANRSLRCSTFPL